MIKGKATIQLFDEKTGEVVREIHEENMITNAVDTILNPPDYIEIGMDSDNDRSFICCVILWETLPILHSVELLSAVTKSPRTAII